MSLRNGEGPADRCPTGGSATTGPVDRAVRWPAPPLSSRHPAALSSYAEGIATLVAGAPYAAALLRRALVHDPGFVLAGVGLVVADPAAGPLVPAPDPSPLTRGERQHVEIVETALRGDLTRAADLRRLHLLEFPGDLLIVWLPAVLGRT